jgi:hypothetical protein
MILPLRSLLTDTIKPGLVVDAQQVWVKKLRGAKYGPYQSETREHVSGIEHAGEKAEELDACTPSPIAILKYIASTPLPLCISSRRGPANWNAVRAGYVIFLPRNNYSLCRNPWRPIWVKNGYGGRSTGTSAVPQIADDFGTPRKSAEVGHNPTLVTLHLP